MSQLSRGISRLVIFILIILFSSLSYYNSLTILESCSRACTQTIDCSESSCSNYYCDTLHTNTCLIQLPNDSPCSINDECISNFCTSAGICATNTSLDVPGLAVGTLVAVVLSSIIGGCIIIALVVWYFCFKSKKTRRRRTTVGEALEQQQQTLTDDNHINSDGIVTTVEDSADTDEADEDNMFKPKYIPPQQYSNNV
jgi:hypothetical protein